MCYTLSCYSIYHKSTAACVYGKDSTSGSIKHKAIALRLPKILYFAWEDQSNAEYCNFEISYSTNRLHNCTVYMSHTVQSSDFFCQI